MTTGERIAQKRKESGLSQEALGERMGVSRQAIYKWESDAALPEIEKLVNLSREFSVSIDWLLGQEDEGEKEELTPEQLRMVEEIVDRYLSARPNPAPAPEEIPEPLQEQSPAEVSEQPPARAKRRRWAWVPAALIIIGIFVNLFSRLDQMNRNYQSLQSAISSVRSDVNIQINGITRQVETILQSQNSLTAEQSAQAVSIDYAANTITISARALPRTFTEGMTAEFLLVSESETVAVPGELDPDHAFTAQLTGPLSDNITVSAAFLTGGQRETQQLGQFTYLYSNSFPEVWVDSNMWGRSNIIAEYAWVRPYPAASVTSAAWDGFPIPEIAQIRMGLFQDGKLLAWYKPLEEQPSSFYGDWDNSRFFQLEGEWVMEPGPVYTIAAIITDEYGRERVFCNGSSFVYDAEEQFVNSCDGMLSSDPADWEY